MSGAIDRAPLRFSQAALLTLMIVALMLDGLDVKLLSYVAPSILSEWRVSEAAFSPALAAALVGMAVGASVGGWMGDRLGRRQMIIGMLMLFAIATMAVSQAENVALLSALRLISGFGFGALTPNALALATEWMPRRLQPRAVALLSASSPLGGVIGALVALWMLPTIGWQGCFMAVGVVTTVFAFGILAWLPESVAFLTARGEIGRAERSWRRMFGKNVTFVPPDIADPPAGFPRVPTRARLFTRALFRLNAGSFLCFFSAYYISYAFSSWLPIILTNSGFPIAKAINGSLSYNVMAILGALISGNLIGYFGSRAVLVTAAIGSFLALGLLVVVLLMQNAEPQIAMVLALVGLCGAFAGVIASTVSAVAVAAYPVELRATGVGFGIMAGRVGGIVTTLGGGILLSMGTRDVRPLFLVLCLMCGLVMFSALLIDRHISTYSAP